MDFYPAARELLRLARECDEGAIDILRLFLSKAADSMPVDCLLRVTEELLDFRKEERRTESERN